MSIYKRIKRITTQTLFFLLVLPLLMAESYNVEMMVVDGNGGKYFDKQYTCSDQETFYQCMTKVPFPDLAKVYYEHQDKTLYTVMKVWENENNNYNWNWWRFNTLTGDVEGVDNTLKNFYFDFYTLFSPNIEFREVRKHNSGDLSKIQSGEEDLFDKKTKELFKKFLNNINYSNFLRFEGNGLKYKGFYIYNYMITENLRTIGVDDPPLLYIYLYKNKNNPAAKYITSIAYETWNGGEELKPDTSSLMSSSPIWVDGNGSCNKINDTEGKIQGLRCFCRNPTHHYHYESCGGVDLQIKDYWDINNLNNYQTLFKNNKAWDYFNIYMMSLIFKTTGVPVFPDEVGGDTDATYQSWKESLSFQETETKKRFTYPFKKLGLDPNGNIIDQLGEPVKCKYFYNIEQITTTGECEDGLGGYYQCQIPVKNKSKPCLETEYDDNGLPYCAKPNYLYNVTVYYYCPSVIVKETNQYLWTFRIGEFNYIVDTANKEEFLKDLPKRCVKDFVKPLANASLSNFENTNKVQVDVENNEITIKTKQGNVLKTKYNGNIYSDTCEYEEISTNVGAYLTSWQGYYIPVALTVDKFKDKNLLDLKVGEFIINKTREDLKGIKSKFCVGSRCAYFFLGEDSDPELIKSYPKIFYLKNYVGVVQKKNNE